MAGGDFGKLALQIGPQQIDEHASLFLRKEQRRAVPVAGVNKIVGRIGTIADKYAKCFAAAQGIQTLGACCRWLLAQVFEVTDPERLNENRVDQVQVPDQTDAGSV